MIREIRMEGIKGQNVSQQLTGRDIIVGRNGAGKTTRLQAMSLAAFGYVPDKGRTADATFELASDDTMTVGITTDDISITREYKKKSKLTSNGSVDVKISQGISISPNQGESTIKQKDQRIKEAMGDFPTMLDFNSFIDLTDNKKRDFIYNLSGASYSWNRDRIASHLRDAVLREELRDNNPEMYEVMQKDYEETMNQYANSLDVQSGLLAMSEHAKEMLAHWKNEKKTADAAAKKLTELKNRGSETDRCLSENQEKLKGLEAEKEEKQTELAKTIAQNRIIESRQKDLQNLITEISQMESDGADSDKLNRLKEDVAEFTERIEKCNADLAEAQREADINTKQNDELIGRMQEKRAYITKLSAEKTTHEATIRSNSKLIERINQNTGFCAFSKDIPCNHDFSEFIGGLNDENDTAYDRIDELNADISQQEEEYAEMSNNSETLKKSISNAMDTAKQYVTSRKSIEEKLNKKRNELQKLENLAPTLTAKTTQRAGIEAWLEENPIIDLADKEEYIDSLKAKIEALKETIDEQKKIRNDIMNIKANIIDSQTSAFEQECWSQIAEAIGQKGIQGAMVKEMLDPLRNIIDEKLASMGMDKKFFFETESERGKEIFRFGWIDRGDKRPFNALSNGEKLMLLIALMTTIIERKNPPVKILALDNCNDLDRMNMQKVIDGLTEAGKNMDNIILAGTMEFTDVPGWKVWKLEE